MNSYVVDTSVVCAWYLPESFSRAARAWRERLLAQEVDLFVPLLHFWEFGNVLQTYVNRGEIEKTLAAEIYDLHLGAPLRRQDPEPASVFDTAVRFGSTTYDAVFIQLASEKGVPLITAERTSTPWVSRMGNQIIPVR